MDQNLRTAPGSSVPKKTKTSIGPKSNEGVTKLLPLEPELGYAIPSSALFPPHSWIFGTVQHLRQFFLDLDQPVGAHFHRGLIDLGITALGGRASVHVP